MEDQGKFNGLGWFTAYRCVWESGLDAFAQLLELKEAESYDWPERDGKEYYLLNRKVKPRTLPMVFLLMGDDEADFWLRFNALEDLLLADGTIDMYVNETRRAYTVFYNRPANAQAITLFTEGGKVCARFTLEFIEPNPRNRPVYDLYYGPCAAIPVTEADVLALTNAVFAAEVTYGTGTTHRFFAFVLQADKSISSVTDTVTGENITDLFILRSTINIGGADKNIYCMVTGAPLPTNHDLEFTII